MRYYDVQKVPSAIVLQIARFTIATQRAQYNHVIPFQTSFAEEPMCRGYIKGIGATFITISVSNADEFSLQICN